MPEQKESGSLEHFLKHSPNLFVSPRLSLQLDINFAENFERKGLPKSQQPIL